jgi:hypothetical protein
LKNTTAARAERYRISLWEVLTHGIFARVNLFSQGKRANANERVSGILTKKTSMRNSQKRLVGRAAEQFIYFC